MRSAIWKLPTVAVFQGIAVSGLVVSFPAAMVSPDTNVAPTMSAYLIGLWPRAVWLASLLLVVLSCRSAWKHLNGGG